MNHDLSQFWNISQADLLGQLKTTAKGLSGDEARKRLLRCGANLLNPKARSNVLSLLLSQFKSPIILILLFAALL